MNGREINPLVLGHVRYKIPLSQYHSEFSGFRPFFKMFLADRTSHIRQSNDLKRPKYD